MNTFRLSLFLAWFETATTVLATDQLGTAVSDTPYDRYLGPMRTVFGRFHGAEPTVDEVRARLRTARRFRYWYDDANPYVPVAPETTEATHQGDCKAKSLWLAWKMDDKRVRFVIGKATSNSRIAHAWLLWNDSASWLALDPTNESDLLDLSHVGVRKLIPHFSYTARSAYAHAHTD